MDEKIIVLVSDRGDSKHGEISILDDPHGAERLVETLLEAGFEQERIQVFSGRQSDFQVVQRPVVALVGDEESGEPQAGIDREEAAGGEPSPPEEETESVSRQEGESETEEEVAATAETAAPVKFSSLFRSA